MNANETISSVFVMCLDAEAQCDFVSPVMLVVDKRLIIFTLGLLMSNFDE